MTDAEHGAEITRLTKEADDAILREKERSTRLFRRVAATEAALRDLVERCDREKFPAGAALVQAKDALAGDDSSLRALLEHAVRMSLKLAGMTPDDNERYTFSSGGITVDPVQLVEGVLRGQ